MVFGWSAVEVQEKKYCNMQLEYKTFWKKKQTNNRHLVLIDLYVIKMCVNVNVACGQKKKFGQPLECVTIQQNDWSRRAENEMHLTTYIYHRTVWSSDLSWLTNNNWARIFKPLIIVS